MMLDTMMLLRLVITCKICFLGLGGLISDNFYALNQHLTQLFQLAG